jgi:hypothetical protein
MEPVSSCFGWIFSSKLGCIARYCKVRTHHKMQHLLELRNGPSGLYYKPMVIVNDDSGVITELETSLTDDARVVIYDRHMFIVPATPGHYLAKFLI